MDYKCGCEVKELNRLDWKPILTELNNTLKNLLKKKYANNSDLLILLEKSVVKEIRYTPSVFGEEYSYKPISKDHAEILEALNITLHRMLKDRSVPQSIYQYLSVPSFTVPLITSYFWNSDCVFKDCGRYSVKACC